MTISTDGPRTRGASLATTETVMQGLFTTTAPTGPSAEQLEREDALWNASFARNPEGLRKLGERARQQFADGKIRSLRSKNL